jgi:hypothetical protein
MAMRAPLTTEKDTPLKISVGPYDFASELTVISDMFFHSHLPAWAGWI